MSDSCKLVLRFYESLFTMQTPPCTMQTPERDLSEIRPPSPPLGTGLNLLSGLDTLVVTPSHFSLLQMNKGPALLALVL